jgi:hypothetical protein
VELGRAGLIDAGNSDQTAHERLRKLLAYHAAWRGQRWKEGTPLVIKSADVERYDFVGGVFSWSAAVGEGLDCVHMAYLPMNSEGQRLAAVRLDVNAEMIAIDPSQDLIAHVSREESEHGPS